MFLCISCKLQICVNKQERVFRVLKFSLIMHPELITKVIRPVEFECPGSNKVNISFKLNNCFPLLRKETIKNLVMSFKSSRPYCRAYGSCFLNVL